MTELLLGLGEQGPQPGELSGGGSDKSRPDWGPGSIYYETIRQIDTDPLTNYNDEPSPLAIALGGAILMTASCGNIDTNPALTPDQLGDQSVTSESS